MAPWEHVCLGSMYALGRGVAQDYIRAHMWANVAGAAGLEGAREIRDHLRDLMTPEQVAEAQRLAREWLEEH